MSMTTEQTSLHHAIGGRPALVAAGLGITDAQFDRTAGHLSATLDALGVPRHLADDIIAIVATPPPGRGGGVTPAAPIPFRNRDRCDEHGGRLHASPDRHRPGRRHDRRAVLPRSLGLPAPAAR